MEGAGLVVTTGQEAGDGLETVSVSQTGQGLPPTLGHHTEQVRVGSALWWAVMQAVRV